MKIIPLFLAMTLLPVVARAQSKGSSNVTDNHQVVPGERIGRVFLGDSRAAVHRRLGKPTATFALPGGLSSELWKSKGESFRKLEVVYRRGVAVQIETENEVFRTKSGLSVITDPELWTARLGKPLVSPFYTYPNPKSNTKEEISQRYFDWKRSGLAIETAKLKDESMDMAGNQTLIVHRKGVAVIRDPGGVAVN